MLWQIKRRQSTFWDFDRPGEHKRVHFIHKREHHFCETHAQGVEIREDHPTLLDYGSDWINVYVSSAAATPSELSANLIAAVEGRVAPWRTARNYFNPDIDLRDLLVGGYGLLFSGPQPLAKAVCAELQTAAVKHMTQSHGRTRQSAKALVAGRNFVIAEAFREA